MSQVTLQYYDYPRGQYPAVPLLYYSMKLGGLALSQSATYNQGVDITENNVYRMLGGSVFDVVGFSTSMNSILVGGTQATPKTIYVAEHRWITGYVDPSVPAVNITFTGDDNSATGSCAITLANVPYLANASIYWYIDTQYYNSQRFTRVHLFARNPNGDGTAAHPWGFYIASSTPDLQDTKPWLNGIRESMRPNEDEENMDDGDWDGTSDDIPVPTFPSVDVLQTGIIRAYKCDSAQLSNIATELWDGTLIQHIEQFFDEPAQAIINLGIVPFQPTSGGVVVPVKIGNYTCSATAYPITSQWYSKSMGSFTLKEYYGSYLDYGSNVTIYLPYIGMRDLNVEDVMGAKLSLLYHIDVIGATCLAMLTCEKKTSRGHKLKSVMYSWNGTMRMDIPLSSTNADDKTVGMLQTVASVAAGVATTVATEGAGAAIGAGMIASGVSSALQTQKTHYTRSGNISGDFSLMGVQTPYIAVTRPRAAWPSKYNRVRGAATYSSGAGGISKLGAFFGMTVCEKVITDGISKATDAEKNEIQKLCREGIIL